MPAPISTSQILTTSDNVTIACDHTTIGYDSVIIVCPGFFNSKKNRTIQQVVALFQPFYDTIVFDFRGHGDSTGLFSWSAREHLDLEAVLDYALRQNYRHIGIVAFSLGAISAINLASRRDEIQSMVLVSAPSGFWNIDYHFWEPAMLSDLKDNFECKWRGKGARVTHFFLRKPNSLASVAKIKRTALFFIHGDTDWVIKDYHSKKLYERASTHKRIEIIKNALHAERLIQQYPQHIEEIICGWFKETLV